MVFNFYFLIVCNIQLIFALNSAVLEFSDSTSKFTANLYKQIIKTESENIIFSPISLQLCLALTLEGAKDSTESELSTALRLPRKATTQAAIRNLELDVSTEKLTLRSSNKLYIASGYNILPEFLDIARDIYQSYIENIDFSNGNVAANIINQWVSSRTNGTIHNLISPKQLNVLTKFILINALYFKGQWSIPFKKRLTRMDKFYAENKGPKDILMMNSEDDYLFLESKELKAKFLEIKYKDGDISMTFVLPHERNGLKNIEENIGEYLKQQSLTTERVAVTIPTFKADKLVDFKDILQKLGVKKLFETIANLTGISKKSGLYVKYVIQKAFIEISEIGTTAAAATAVIGAARALPGIPFPPPELVFKADHPFLFYIKENTSELILFIGRFQG